MNKIKLKIPNYPKFQNKKLKILIITDGFFLFNDFNLAFSQLKHQTFTFEIKHNEVIIPFYFRRFANYLSQIKPDFIFSINLIGFDKQGKLAAMLAALKLRNICYLINHPFIVLEEKKKSITENTKFFVIDSAWQKLLKKHYQTDSQHLPLAISHYSLELSKRIETNQKTKNFIFYGSSNLKELSAYENLHPANLDEEQSDKLLGQLGYLATKSPQTDIHQFILEIEKKDSFTFEFETDLEKKKFCLKSLFLADLLNKKKFLAKFDNLKIFGDENWNLLNENYQAKQIIKHSDLLKLYASSKIMLNISSLLLPTTFSQKFLEAFLFDLLPLVDERTDYSLILPPEFKFITENNLLSNYNNFLEQEEKRQEVLAFAKNEIIKNHQYLNRSRTIIEKVLPENSP